jgi:hypothetical protein
MRVEEGRRGSEVVKAVPLGSLRERWRVRREVEVKSQDTKDKRRQNLGVWVRERRAEESRRVVKKRV